MEYPFKDLQPLDEVTARTGYYKDWTHIDADTFHQISELVKFIREKGYGADTREAIAQALERVYHDAAQSGNANMEVSMARAGFNTLGERLNDTTAQLAQTHKKDEQTVGWNNIKQDARDIMMGNNPMPIVGKDSVGTENIIDGSVDFSKQSFMSGDRSDNLFDGGFSSWWIDNYENPEIYYNDNEDTLSVIVPIKNGGIYNIKTSSKTNRFNVALAKEVKSGVLAQSITRLRNTQVENTGPHELTLTNYENYNFLIVAVGVGVALSRDDVVITKINENKKIAPVNRVVLDGQYGNNQWLDFRSGTWWPGDNGNYILIAPIPQKTSIKIQTLGEHNRFHLLLSNASFKTESDGQFESLLITDETDGNEEFSFYNDNYKYLYIGLNRNDTTEVDVVMEYTFVENIKSEIIDIVSKEVVPQYISDIKNELINGNLSLEGSEGLETRNSGVSIENNEAKAIAYTNKGGVGQRFNRQIGNLYYYSADIKADSNKVTLYVNEGSTRVQHSGSGEYERLYHLQVAPNSSNVLFSVNDERTENFSEYYVKNFNVINLTKLFDEQTEPDIALLSNVLDTFYDGVAPHVNNTPITNDDIIKKMLDKSRGGTSQGIRVSNNRVQTRETYPVLFGVKLSHNLDRTSRPVGWLYYDPRPPHDLYYANGSPDNIEFLCEWNTDITWDGSKDPSWYRPAITDAGDIVFVYRGDKHGTGATDSFSRQNPIIYPANNWSKPVVVDLGSSIKPTAWLQNTGVDYVNNTLLFGEYTRPHHESAHIWKVTEPVTNPNNWHIKKSFELSGSNLEGMKHLHQMNYDPWSGFLYTSTGDDDSAAAIYSSSDMGETWDLEFSGERRYARVLNFIFTKDSVFWANDDHRHGFYSVNRNSEGVPDFNNITTLYEFTEVPPTYINALIDTGDVYGILMLHRYDGPNDNTLPVHFFDLKTNIMHVIKEVSRLEDEILSDGWGFRVEAASWYEKRGASGIVLGFNTPPNSMDLLNNVSGSNLDKINNMILKVVEVDGGYDLEISAVQY